MLMSVSACSTSIPGDYCDVAPPLTPKAETMEDVTTNDPVFTDQIYQHWALMDDC